MAGSKIEPTIIESRPETVHLLHSLSDDIATIRERTLDSWSKAKRGVNWRLSLIEVGERLEDITHRVRELLK